MLKVTPRFVCALFALSLVACCSRFELDGSRTEAQGLVKLFTDGTSIAGTGVYGDPLHSLVTMSTGIFGDGSDGACHFDGVSTVLGASPIAAGAAGLDPADPLSNYVIYLQPRDFFCTTVLVDNNVLMDTYNFRLLGSVSITTNGNALLGPPGCAGYAGGAGGCGPTATGSIPTAAPFGGNGNTGAGSSGGNSAAPLPRGDATAGGNGGAGVAAGGGGGGTASAFTATQGDLHNLYSCLSGRTPSGVVIGNVVSATGGGGGGDNGTHHGGGGGGGGGYLVVASPRIITNDTSTLIASGGHGGAGATGGGATGGGGGGGGGVACVAIGGGAQPALTVAGGAGGAGGSGGASGAAGHAGIVLGPSGAAWVVGVQ